MTPPGLFSPELLKSFEFPDFVQAVGFVNAITPVAEAEGHHPDLEISYNRVKLRWTTHSAGGITDRDRDMAARSAALA